MSRFRKNIDIYFADFETLTYNSKDFKRLNHTDVYLWFIMNKNGDFKKWGRTIDDFFKFLYEDGKSKIIYFHNLSFDGDFIRKYLERIKLPFCNIENKNTKQVFWEEFSNNNIIYSICVHKKIRINNKIKKFHLDFKCSYQLLSAPIESLGKDLKMNKYNLDKIKSVLDEHNIKYDKNNEHEIKLKFYDLGGFDLSGNVLDLYLEYIESDVNIARTAFNILQEELNSIKYNYSKKFKKPLNIFNILTIGSYVYKLSKNYLWDNGYKNVGKGYKIHAIDYKLAKNWYYGGYTEYSPQYHNQKLDNINGVYIDINSSYPNQMCKLLPYGELLETKPNSKYYLEYYEIEVEKAVIKYKYRNLVCLKNWKKITKERYCTHLLDFKCFYTKQEWEFLNKIYDFKVKSIKTYYAKADYYFRDFINELYHFKNDYKNKGKKSQAHTYKILLNSLYGKQASRMQFNVRLFTNLDRKNELLKFLRTDEQILINDKKYKVVGDSSKHIGHLVSLILEPEIDDHKKCTNILIGAQITSYARLQLWETIYKIGTDKFLYSDTDSIMFKDIDKNKISKYVKIHDSNLGEWDIECELKSGKILGAKRYIFFKPNGESKFAFAGVNNLDVNEFNYEEIIKNESILSESVMRRVEDDYGIYFIYKDYKINLGGL